MNVYEVAPLKCPNCGALHVAYSNTLDEVDTTGPGNPRADGELGICSRCENFMLFESGLPRKLTEAEYNDVMARQDSKDVLQQLKQFKERCGERTLQ